MGQEGAGKSCFCDSLLDEPWSGEGGRPSTKGLMMKTAVIHAVGDDDNWTILKTEDQQQEEIDKLFAIEYLSRSDSSELKADDYTMSEEDAMGIDKLDSTESKEGLHLEQQQHSVREDSQGNSSMLKHGMSQTVEPDTLQQQHTIQKQQQQDPNIGRAEFQKARDLDNRKAALISLMKKNKEELRKSGEMVLINIMDRGGQEQFLLTHAALMADTSYNSLACFLVIDGTKPLDEAITKSVLRLENGNSKEQKPDVLKEGRHVVRYWSAAIDAAYPAPPGSFKGKFLGMSFVKRPPVVFIIVTRKDETKDKQEDVQKLEQILTDIISEHNFGDHVVFYIDGDTKKILFHVDNTRSGTGSPDQVVVDIRKMLVTMTRKFWEKQVIPLPWAVLDSALRLMANKHHVIDFETVWKLAREFCEISSEDECRLALRYLSSLGCIGFYHEAPGLENKVLPSIQWASDVMSVFVTVLTEKDVTPDLLKALPPLRSEGLMSWKLAEHLMDKAEVKKEDHGVILPLLNLFNIISPALQTEIPKGHAAIEPQSDFFVPCMVRREYTSTPLAYRTALSSSDGPPPLFLSPKDFSAFLKPLFYRLVSRLLAIYTKKAELSRNQVIVHLPDDLELELAYTPKAVIATVYPFPSHEPTDEKVFLDHCFNVRTLLFDQLMEAKKRGMDGFQFEVCIHKTVVLRDAQEFDYDPCDLACLDEYEPGSSGIVNKRGKKISCPKKLSMWFDSKQKPVAGTYSICLFWLHVARRTK